MDDADYLPNTFTHFLQMIRLYSVGFWLMKFDKQENIIWRITPKAYTSAGSASGLAQ